jgi:phosphoserine phosphatase
MLDMLPNLADFRTRTQFQHGNFGEYTLRRTWINDPQYRLAAFDMDSTLIQTEVINELANVAGAGEQVAAITESAMRGEIDFKQSLMQRVFFLAGIKESALQTMAKSLPLSKGVVTVMDTLKRKGYKTAIISSGFDYFGEYLQHKLGIDYVYANTLEIRNGKLTGRVLGQIVDGPKKAELLKQLAAGLGVRLEQTIAVGDGANDLLMLDAAGLGVAFNAKPVVREHADLVISNQRLDELLSQLRILDREEQNSRYVARLNRMLTPQREKHFRRNHHV